MPEWRGGSSGSKAAAAVPPEGPAPAGRQVTSMHIGLLKMNKEVDDKVAAFFCASDISFYPAWRDGRCHCMSRCYIRCPKV